MTINRILITGHFWDSEFRNLIVRINVPALILPIGKIADLKSLDGSFDLVILVQARRASISQSVVSRLNELTSNAPIVNLLGSWCEGQERSGKPLKNVSPVYWHQWSGEFQQLLEIAKAFQLGNDASLEGVSQMRLKFSQSNRSRIGISALSWVQGAPSWIERNIEEFAGLNGFSAICVDGDSLTHQLEKRLRVLINQFPDVPLLILMNFPRRDEVEKLAKLFGVTAVLSKPFDMSQLAHALATVTDAELIEDQVVPERCANPGDPQILVQSANSTSR
jgi:hypothetical protein